MSDAAIGAFAFIVMMIVVAFAVALYYGLIPSYDQIMASKSVSVGGSNLF